MVKSEKFIRKIYQKIFRILVKSENFIRKFYQKIFLILLCLLPFLLGPDSFFLFLVSWLALPSESVSESDGKRSKPRYILLIAYIPLYFSMFFTYTLTVKIIYLHCKNHIPSMFFNDTFRWKTPTEKPWRSRAYYAILWGPGPSKKEETAQSAENWAVEWKK